MTLADLMATSAAIIRQSLPRHAGEDSYNMLPALLSESDKKIHDVTIHHSGGGVFAIRVDDWKMIWESEEGGYDNGPEKGSPGQLYNLKNDPFEENNLFNVNNEKVLELSEQLTKIRSGD